MAAIDNLVKQISDAVLRQRIADEVKQLSQNKKFGLADASVNEARDRVKSAIKNSGLFLTSICRNVLRYTK